MTGHTWRMNTVVWPIVGQSGRCTACGAPWRALEPSVTCRGIQPVIPIEPLPGAEDGSRHLLLRGKAIVCLEWHGMFWLDGDGNTFAPTAMGQSDAWFYGGFAGRDARLSSCRPSPPSPHIPSGSAQSVLL